MCGIAGFFARPGASGVAGSEAMLRSMQSALLHRGPDGHGLWLDRGCAAGLAHVRLAIMDPSPAGAQPMLSPDGRYVISFNGEIYNFHALREELRGQGKSFRTDSDTEVLLALLQRDGPAGLPRLRGMFALAVWDIEAGRGLLARDGLGIKPLYYAETSSGMVFASELRSLLAAGALNVKLDTAAVAGFFATGSVPEPATLVEGARMLPPGHFLEWSAGRATLGRFWNVEFPEPSVLEGAAVDLTRRALEDSIAAHFVSDVPVGLFLSGGIDSTALLALARDLGLADGLAAFSIAVEDSSFNEAEVAADTAREFGVDHHVLRLDAASAQESFAAFIDSMDVPSVDGFNTWTVSRLARANGIKVALSGLGGDEMFGGYPSFRRVPRLHAGSQALANVPPIGKAVGSLVGRFARASRWQRAGELLHPGNTFADAYRAYRGNFPMSDAVRLAAHFTGASEKSVRETMVPDQTRLPQNPLDAVSYLEITRFMRNQLLRDSDVMSMAHGLELRLPLVDQRLFDTIAGIPAAIRLQPGKKLLLDAVPGIPAQVRNARKRGFSFPIRAWLEEDLGADFASATQGLPVGAREWYQKWSVLTFTRWLGAHA